MTRRFAVSIAFTLLLLGGCGDSPTPTSLAATEFDKGVDFAAREDWDTAIACFREAIRLKPDDADAYYNRGLAYRKKGEPAKANADFARAEELKAKK
jgi:Flp pilus assembly protein TadD